jgi:hypothetical protein
MMTRRRSTAAPEPPVRFYKIVAFSFLIITVVLLGVVIFMTSKKATIIVIGKEDTLPVNFEISVGDGLQIDQGASSGIVTSTVFNWSKKYSPQGTKVIEGVAEGELIIYNKASTPITLIPKTRFQTSEGKLFRLKTRTTVPANGEISAEVYADQPGRDYEVGPSQFILPALPADRQKTVYAISSKSMSGGANQIGVLTQEDIEAAKTDYKQKVVEEFLAKNSSLIPPKHKTVVTISDSNVHTSQTAGGEVSEFAVSGTSTLIVVYYNTDDLEQLLTKEINRKINVSTDKVLSLSKDPQVSLTSYDLEKNTARLAISQDIIVSVDETAPKLAPQNFLSMRKDEIEKYVQGLDHVAGVDIRFTPSWMKSAPESSDKIKVIVRNIK